MEKPLDPKTAFVNAFKEIMKSKAISKITVIDLVSKSGLSRQTFYRYFTGIDDLIYYIHNQNVSVSYNIMDRINYDSTGLKIYLDFMKENQQFYQQIITLDEVNAFSKLYFAKTKENLIRFTFKNDMELIESDPKIMFAIDFYVYAFCNSVLEWIKKKTPYSTEYLAEVLIENMPDILKKYWPEDFNVK